MTFFFNGTTSEYDINVYQKSRHHPYIYIYIRDFFFSFSFFFFAMSYYYISDRSQQGFSIFLGFGIFV